MNFEGMSKDELLVQVLALMADRLTKPSDMEWLSGQAQRLKAAMAREDAVSNTVIEEYLKRVNLLSGTHDGTGFALTEGVKDSPGLGQDGIDVLKAAEARNQALMDEISGAYRAAYNQPAALPANGKPGAWKTVPQLPEAVLPPLLNKGPNS
jgi:hypothetical protein